MDPATADQIGSLLGSKSYFQLVNHLELPEWWFDPLEKNARKQLLPRSELFRTVEEAKRWSCSVFQHAAAEGHLNVLRWVHREFPHTVEEVKSRECMAFRLAAWNGHLEVLQWLHQEFPHSPEDAKLTSGYAYSMTDYFGQSHVLDWLNKTFGECVCLIEGK